MRARLAFTLVGRRAFRPRVLAAIKPRERSCLRWQLTVCNFGFTRLVAVSACTSGLDTAVETISPPYIEQRRPATGPAPRRTVRDRGRITPRGGAEHPHSTCRPAIIGGSTNPAQVERGGEYIGATTPKPKARHANARAVGRKRHAIARAPGPGKHAIARAPGRKRHAIARAPDMNGRGIRPASS